MWRMLNPSFDCWGQTLFRGLGGAWPVFAQTLPESNRPREIDPNTRFQMLAALAFVLILAAMAIIVIRAAGRLVRWYARDHREYRVTRPPAPDVDDWAHKPLAPPLDELPDERPLE